MPEENTAPYAYPPDLARFVQFDKGDESVVVGVDGALYIDDLDTSIRAAADDVGLAFSFVEHVKRHLENGALVRVLDDWCAPFPGCFLYYPSLKLHPSSGRTSTSGHGLGTESAVAAVAETGSRRVRTGLPQW